MALADEKIGNSQEATAILTALHSRFPNDSTISDSLNTLMAPPAPVVVKPETNTKPTTNSKTEKVKKLPVPTDTTSNNNLSN